MKITKFQPNFETIDGKFSGGNLSSLRNSLKCLRILSWASHLRHHLWWLHPFFRVVAEQSAHVDEHHQGAGDSQGKHRCLCRAGLDNRNCFVCEFNSRLFFYLCQKDFTVNLPFPKSVLGSLLRRKSRLFSSPKSRTRISCEMFISSSVSLVSFPTERRFLPHDSIESRPHSQTAGSHGPKQYLTLHWKMTP